ncbi:hypothetical protein OH802_21360 [Nocardioides sp. NBC_00850]|uniref:hypothetical protein n=1 Tax=Nocardioides sp. NBC_00850 TaxID=2976001 RepID=UPI0038672147|nr:hypothetical protein OH802_21360 [Nocardioides sp. NBC_00850]
MALDGAGWHPAAWREPNAGPADLLKPGYWADLVGEAETGLPDFVTIEDSLSIQTDSPFGTDDERTDRVRGRLDAAYRPVFEGQLAFQASWPSSRSSRPWRTSSRGPRRWSGRRSR